MVKEDLTRWQNYLKGDRFAWDAPSDVAWDVKVPKEYKLDR